ncbi:MAG TPA: DUF1564 family protein [Leptospiraceae bacterium]|nr:DUF1564 family protein [Leptospiraceae bacterium]HRG72983.1 DUF1564 family protein [Leptospiraceae bacterium]
MNSDSKENNQNDLISDNGKSDEQTEKGDVPIMFDDPRLVNPLNDDSGEIADDPSLWTWLPNSRVSSEEENYLLLRHEEHAFTQNNQFVEGCNFGENNSENTPVPPNQELPLGFNEALGKALKQANERYAGFTADGYENGKTVTNRKNFFPKENYKGSDIRSSILIPEKYLSLFYTKAREHCGVRAYIVYLLAKYRIHISNGLVPAYSNLTTKYQEKGQDLKKIGFRPNPADWAELKLYRVSFGMSISAFLIYLLIADSTDFAQTLSYFLWSVGIPATPSLDLAAKLYLCHNRDYYSAVFQFRESNSS